MPTQTRRAQGRLARILALFAGLLAALVLFSGLGGPGLSDPWEMNPAYLARLAASRPLIYVAGGRGDREISGLLEPVTASTGRASIHWLSERRTARSNAAGAAADLRRARSSIDERDFHAVVIPAPKTDVAQDGGYRAAWSELARQVSAELPGSFMVLLGPEAETAAAALDPGAVPLRTATDAAEVEELLEELASLPPRLLRVHTSDGVYGVPPLRYWLAAFSYRVLGFNELATRAPGALLGVAVVLMTFLVAHWLAGPWAGLLASLILLGTPYLPVQARSIAGEVGFVAYLTLGVVGLATLLRGRAVLGSVLWLGALALLFLEKGLFGLLVGFLLVLSLAIFELRRHKVLGALVVASGAALGVMAALVLLPEGWSFLSHFRMMNHPFEGGPGNADRSFDFFVLQAGFGLLPWIVLVPFALTELATGWFDADDEGSPLRGLVLLWVVVPFVALAATLLHFSHCVFPAGTAMAVALAVFAVRMGDDERPWPLRALFVALALLLLVGELKLSPHPLVGTVTWDPPFVFEFKEIHKGVLFPEVVKVPSAMRLLGYAVLLWIVYSWIKGADIVDTIRRAARRPRAFYGGLFILAAVLFLDLAVSLGLRIQSLVITSGRAIPATEIHKLNRLAWARPEHWVLYVALLWSLAGAIVDLPFIRDVLVKPKSLAARGLVRLLALMGIKPRRHRSTKPRAPGIPLGSTDTGLRVLETGRYTGRLDLIGAVGVLLCALGLLFGLAMAKEPSSLMVAFLDPLAIVGAAAWIFALVRTWRRDLPRPIVLGAALWWLYVAARAARAAGLFGPLSFVLVLVPALFVLARLGPYLRAEALRARIFQLAVLLVLGLSLLAPMAIQHELLVPRARLPDAVGYLDRLGFGSPDVFVIAGLLAVWAATGWAWRLEKMEARVGKALLHLLIAGCAVIAAAAMFLAPSIQVPEGAARLSRALCWLPLLAIAVDLLAIVRARWRGSHAISEWFFRMLRYAEAPRVLVAGIAVLSLVLSGMTIFKFVPELSYHVSQKHILDTYRQAEARADVGQDIFRHGRFSSSAGSDHNFYIHSIPEVSSQSTVLDLLAAKKDTSLRLTDSPFLDLPEHVVFRAFDAANDNDGDGRRDWPAEAGLADSVEGTLLVSKERRWKPDEWKGAVVVDPSGRAHEVLSNTETEIRFATPPWRKRAGSPDTEYRLDSKKATNHLATAMEPKRAFVVLPKTSFSALNFAFRRRNKGLHIPVLDDRSSRLVLLSSFLQPGEDDMNWISKAVITEQEMKQIESFQPSMTAFDDKLILEGVSLSESVVRRGGTVKAAFYFRVKAGVARSYKIFIHIDRPGTSHRIGVDHWVLNLPGHDNQKTCVGCLKTNEWLKGDVVVDSFDIKVPLGTPSGPQHIWMGLYEPNSGMRLRVSDFDKNTVEHDGHNRVRVAIFTVL